MISAVRARRQAIRRKLHVLLTAPPRHGRDRLRLNCTLPRTLYERIHRHARRAGRPPTSFLREAALAYLERRYLVPANLEQRLLDLTAVLRNVAGNINQLAAKANTLKRVTVFDLLSARRLVLFLEKSVKSFVRQPPEEPPRNSGPA